MDYIDACVFLAVVFGEHDERCTSFLNRTGYRRHPAGVISHHVVSELFISILTKRHGRLRDEIALVAVKLLSRLVDERNFVIAKISRDERLFDSVKEQDYRVSDDDAFHLVAAITAGCDRFVTIDGALLSAERLQGWLKREFGLKLVAP
jgi:predicted nucleic acid-binding protein